jgi:hypothetical protein
MSSSGNSLRQGGASARVFFSAAPTLLYQCAGEEISMKRASVAGAFALCLGLTVACGGRTDEQKPVAERDPKVLDDKDGRPATISETGCLTASGGRFVLTNLERSDGTPTTTISYQLVGNEDEFRRLVGQQVRVTGDADPSRVAEVREMSPATATGTSGQQARSASPKPGEPQVSTTQETRLEVSQLLVRSIADAGQPCAPPPASGTPRP